MGGCGPKYRGNTLLSLHGKAMEAPSVRDLKLLLDAGCWFTDECKVAGMRISTSETRGGRRSCLKWKSLSTLFMCEEKNSTEG